MASSTSPVSSPRDIVGVANQSVDDLPDLEFDTPSQYGDTPGDFDFDTVLTGEDLIFSPDTACVEGDLTNLDVLATTAVDTAPETPTPAPSSSSSSNMAVVIDLRNEGDTDATSTSTSKPKSQLVSHWRNTHVQHDILRSASAQHFSVTYDDDLDHLKIEMRIQNLRFDTTLNHPTIVRNPQVQVWADTVAVNIAICDDSNTNADVVYTPIISRFQADPPKNRGHNILPKFQAISQAQIAKAMNDIYPAYTGVAVALRTFHQDCIKVIQENARPIWKICKDNYLETDGAPVTSNLALLAALAQASIRRIMADKAIVIDPNDNTNTSLFEASLAKQDAIEPKEQAVDAIFKLADPSLPATVPMKWVWKTGLAVTNTRCSFPALVQSIIGCKNARIVSQDNIIRALRKQRVELTTRINKLKKTVEDNAAKQAESKAKIRRLQTERDEAHAKMFMAETQEQADIFAEKRTQLSLEIIKEEDNIEQSVNDTRFKTIELKKESEKEAQIEKQLLGRTRAQTAAAAAAAAADKDTYSGKGKGKAKAKARTASSPPPVRRSKRGRF